MERNLKEVLNTQEFNRFMSLLKDIVPYQLKIDKAHGCPEILNKEDMQIFQQLKNELKPYYDQLDKAWFT
jgi:hypothetical protein